MNTLNDPGTSRLIRKLEHYTTLTDEDKHALANAVSQSRLYGPHETLVAESDPPTGVNLILSGFACRYKTLPDGRRQIVAYFLPGDVCDVRIFLLKRMDHAIGTIAATKVAILSGDALVALMDRSPSLTRAFWWATLVEEAIAREWLVNVGQRTALERVAHLFCEVFVRLQAVGLTDGTKCELPVTQSELADTLALSTVHINRTLRELRREGLVSMRGKLLEIHDLDALKSVAMFDPGYLHLGDTQTARVWAARRS